MGIQSTLLGALGAVEGAVKAKQLEAHVQKGLELKERKVKVAEAREERMQQESPAKTAYYKSTSATREAQARRLNQQSDLADIQIKALKRALNAQDIKSNQKKIIKMVQGVKEKI